MDDSSQSWHRHPRLPPLPLAGWIAELLFPSSCVACGASGSVFCDACLSGLRPVPAPLCERCGAPVACRVGRCRDCAGRRLAFASARSAFLYTPAVRALVHAWKERGLRRVATLAADLTCGVLEPPAVEAIVPVAPDAGRLLTRGHHPPRSLAEGLGRRWELPVLSPLDRCGPAPRQAALRRDDRRRNVRGAFVVRGNVPRSLLLVDDVFTTGATTLAAASALRRGGASEVHVITFARAVR